MKKYKLVSCGGTFDLFHDGHKDFLRFVFSLGERIAIGITTDQYVRSEKNNEAEPFEVRKNAVEKFIQEENATDFVEIMSIDDVFGPTLDPDFYVDALAVSEDSQKGAEIINQGRKKMRYSKLPILVHPLLKVEGNIVSSSLIRKGIINREGRLHENPEWLKKTLNLPESFREELRKPFGKIVQKIPQGLDPKKTVTVGDIVSKTFNTAKFGQKISFVDLLVERKKTFSNIAEHGFDSSISARKINNPPGTLTPELFFAIKEAIDSEERSVIEINGEEDLSVLPVLIYAPLGFSIFYGQPGVGMVVIKVTEENKEKAYALISKFTS